jgi:hypothetical protein
LISDWLSGIGWDGRFGIDCRSDNIPKEMQLLRTGGLSPVEKFTLPEVWMGRHFAPCSRAKELSPRRRPGDEWSELAEINPHQF